MVLVRSIAAAFRQWFSRSFSPAPTPAPADSRELGEWGEAQAAQFLRREGCKILRANYRAKGGGEVDLVCRHGEELVFVEVKTRRHLQFGTPSEAVNRAKQQLITKGALGWLRLLGNPDLIFRFDIVEVIAEEGEFAQCEWIQDAFELNEPYLY